MKPAYRACGQGARRRGAALGLDTLLVAYALWCVDRLAPGLTPAGGLLDGYPRLLAVAPLLAVLWQVGGSSAGQRVQGLALVDADGAPARRAARARWGLAAGVQTALVLLPLWGLWGRPAGLLLSGGLAVCFALLAVAARSERSGPEVLAGLWHRPVPGPDREVVPWVRRPGAWIALLLLGLTFAVGVKVTDLAPGRLVEGAAHTRELRERLLDPDWSITPRVVGLLVETVYLALMASALALPFAFGLSFLGARNLTRGSLGGRVAYGLARVLMNVTRSIEPLVWAIVFVLWVGIGPFAGMLALFVHSVAALAKLYSEAIEAIDTGPVEAIQATGARPLQVLRYGVVPQVIPPFLAFTVYRWDINVRMATILGLVGGGGIGDLLVNYQQLGAWSKVGTIIVFITLVVWLLDTASARVRARIT